MLKVKTIVTGELQENCYIIEGEKACLIVDPGSDFDNIVKEITLPVLGVLITHRHFDHIGDLEEILEKYKCQMFDYYSTDEENFKVKEFNFSVINTPGHTEDSVCYFFYEDKIMFTGDFLFKGSIGRTDLGGNESDMMKSIEKIKKYDEDIVIYPGHGKRSTLGEEFKYNIYLS